MMLTTRTTRTPGRGLHRITRFVVVPAVVLTATAALTSCSKDEAKSKSSDVAVATESATAAATDAPAAADAPATDAPAATEAPAPATEAPAGDTTPVAAGDSAAAPDAAALEAASAAFVPGMLQQFNGGKTPDPADVKCLSDKIKPEDIQKMMTTASGGGLPPEFKNIFKAMIDCKPKGLSDSFTSSFASSMPASVTDDQKKCLGDKILQVVGSNDEILDAMIADAATPPPAFKDAATKAVKDCINDKAAQDELLKQLTK